MLFNTKDELERKAGGPESFFLSPLSNEYFTHCLRKLKQSLTIVSIFYFENSSLDLSGLFISE